MKLAFLIVAIVLGIVLDSSNGAIPCRRRQLNHDSVVCVCDETYCDTVDPIRRRERGLVQILNSGRDGRRLFYREQNFNDDSTPPEGQPWDVSIDRNQRYQEILGFGGAWSDAAGSSIASLPTGLQRTLLNSYYSQSGIEYSMARGVISGSDFSNRPYSYDDTDFDDWELANWSLVEEDILYKIPQMKLAQEIAGNLTLKFFASSWSPPRWMKTNNQFHGAGTLKEQAGSRTWKTYARYLLKFFDEYKSNGVNFWGMTVQNEPATGLGGNHPWNTCGFTGEMERDFVKTDLGPILESGGYTPENFNIMVLDHNRDIVQAWAYPSLSDLEASRYISGTAVHWYGNYAAGPEVYDELHFRFPDKLILATEACNRGPDVRDRTALGRWDLAEEYAHDIITDLTHWVTGWVDWNLALDIQGGPNWADNFHSAPIIVNATAREFYKNTQYYAMAHFSKILPPGSVRIGTNNGQLVENEKFQLAAFLRPDNGVAIIAINSWDARQFVTLTDPELGVLKVKIEPRSFDSWVYYS